MKTFNKDIDKDKVIISLFMLIISAWLMVSLVAVNVNMFSGSAPEKHTVVKAQQGIILNKYIVHNTVDNKEYSLTSFKKMNVGDETIAWKSYREEDKNNGYVFDVTISTASYRICQFVLALTALAALLIVAQLLSKRGNNNKEVEAIEQN